MKLTKGNYALYAASIYDNPSCISEAEFVEDLGRISTIKRMVSKYRNGESVNVRLLVNNVITFYNVFEHHGASRLIEFKIDSHHAGMVNAILAYLSFPLVDGYAVDAEFYHTLEQEFGST